MALPARLKMRSEQYNKEQKLKAMGFAHVDNSRLGSVWEMIDSEGFMNRIVITLEGRLMRYKPTKALLIEQQKLPRVKQKYGFLDGSGTFV